MHRNLEEEFQGFSKLSRRDRLARLLKMGVLKPSDIDYLERGAVQGLALAESFIENPIGYFQLPMGVATNFNIDGRDVVIPMAVEETSIIAAASKTARWIRKKGHIRTQICGRTIIGQIQLPRVKDFPKLSRFLDSQRSSWIREVNEKVVPSMFRRGGGVEDIQLRKVERQGEDCSMGVFHVFFNPCDAMGANGINQVCEYLKKPIEDISGDKVNMCILSNLVDSRLTVAQVEVHGVDGVLGERIEEASFFAYSDPYRAATNNKGVLNGVDPVLIATGNDWRAVEAGVHAYASRRGQYRSITRWSYRQGVLKGEFKAPVIVGTVGGVTSLHPTARMCLNMLKVTKACELSRICGAVGLVQNLGALRALTTEGIIEGHMKLHIKNLSLGVGASQKEVAPLEKALEEQLLSKKNVTQSDALNILKKIRSGVSKGSNVALDELMDSNAP